METQGNPNEPIRPTATGQEGGQQGGGSQERDRNKERDRDKQGGGSQEREREKQGGVANREVAAKSPAKKAADDKLRKRTAKALGDCALD